MADRKEAFVPGAGADTQISDPITKMLKQAEEGKLGGTLRQSRPDDGRVIRPFTSPPRDYSTPPSKAPRGMGNAVQGDLGKYRQIEAKKVFPGLPGKDTASGLPFRKPQTGIDAKFGPGDKVS